MKKSIRTAIISTCFFVSLSSCSNKYEFEPNPITEPQILIDSSILSYSKINDLVIAPKCLGCHSGQSEPLLNSYNLIFANKQEIYEQVFVSHKMPKNRPLSESQMKALKLWLDAGAPEQMSTEVKTPSDNSNQSFERPVLWAQVRDKVIARNCTSCHFAGNTDGISSYEDYETVKSTIGTIFYTVSIQPVMPPPPSGWPEDQPNPNQLTREQKDLISAWVNDGMKE